MQLKGRTATAGQAISRDSRRESASHECQEDHIGPAESVQQGPSRREAPLRATDGRQPMELGLALIKSKLKLFIGSVAPQFGATWGKLIFNRKRKTLFRNQGTLVMLRELELLASVAMGRSQKGRSPRQTPFLIHRFK
jgi:hypothetical protein